MGDIQKRLDNVRQMIQSQDFLEGKGLSNEVNIRILSCIAGTDFGLQCTAALSLHPFEIVRFFNPILMR